MTEVKVPAKRDYIGGGAFGGVFKGELHGDIVALKVLYKTSDNVVSPQAALAPRFLLRFVLKGILSRGVDVGNAQARVCTVVPGNL